jgi:predicted membrane protein
MNKKIVYFILISFFYMMFFIASSNWACNLNTMKGQIVLFLASVMFTLVIFGLSYATGILNEGFYYQTSPGKLCQGGPYMHSGNSATDKMCQKLYSTEKGNKEINNYNCGKGFLGMPIRHWQHTNLSNDQWNNNSCDNLNETEGNDGVF